MDIRYEEFSNRLEEVISIYKKERWLAYLNDNDKLKRAFDNSLYVLGAFSEDKLVGFIRVVGDGEHIVLVQDLIVDCDYQKKGIGSMLFQLILEKYKKVRMFMVVTDLYDEIDNHFYQKFNLKPLEKGEMISYYRS